jgi:hypothetical protein
MATEKEVLKLDLDSEEFIKKILKARESVEGLGEAKNLLGLVEGFEKVAGVIGVAGAALYGVKKAFDFVEEAEEIKAINNQFEVMTKQAGIATEALEKGLMDAAKGLVDDTDLLKAANEAILKMGGSAQRLPEIMELARKATSVMGGDLLKNFEALSGAIAGCNTRALRQLGIVIDNESAMIKYAKSIGVTVNALSEQGKKQAVLNAALEVGKRINGENEEQLRTTSKNLERMKVSLNNLGEAFLLAFDKIAGPTVQRIAKSLANLADQAKNSAQLLFGSQKDQLKAAADLAQSEAEKLRERLKGVYSGEEDVGVIQRLFYGGGKGSVIERREKIAAEIRRDISKLEAQAESMRLAAEGGVKKAGAEEAPAKSEAEVEAFKISNAKKFLEATKFEQDLVQLRQQRLDAEMAIATSEDQVNAQFGERRILLLEEIRLKQAELDAQVQLGQITRETAALRLEELERTTQANITATYLQEQNARLKALNNFAEANKKTMAGIMAGAKAAAAESSKDWNNFSAIGKMSFKAFETNAVSSLLALGEGSKNAGEAMKGFMFGALADIAEAQGRILLPRALMGDFLSASAGAGLIVLAGFLRSLSKGPSTKMPETGAGGGGGFGGADTSAATAGPSPVMAASEAPTVEARKRREVTLMVQGNYFETEQTKRTLMEMIRSETDATGFSYVQIGQGGT